MIGQFGSETGSGNQRPPDCTQMHKSLRYTSKPTSPSPPPATPDPTRPHHDSPTLRRRHGSPCPHGRSRCLSRLYHLYGSLFVSRSPRGKNPSATPYSFDRVLIFDLFQARPPRTRPPPASRLLPLLVSPRRRLATTRPSPVRCRREGGDSKFGELSRKRKPS